MLAFVLCKRAASLKPTTYAQPFYYFCIPAGLPGPFRTGSRRHPARPRRQCGRSPRRICAHRHPRPETGDHLDPSGTVEFHHVSYATYFLPTSDFSKSLTVVLSDQELAPAIAHSGRVREKYLLKRGVTFLNGQALGVFTPAEGTDQSGELGSAVNVKHPFRIGEIALQTVSNSIAGCVLSFSIYRVSDHDSVFENILTHPIYANIPVSDSAQTVTVHPGEDIVLEPGRYFFGIQVVDYDRSAYQAKRDGLAFKIHLQDSYYRETPVAKPVRIPVNVGLTVKGKEYL